MFVFDAGTNTVVRKIPNSTESLNPYKLFSIGSLGGNNMTGDTFILSDAKGVSYIDLKTPNSNRVLMTLPAPNKGIWVDANNGIFTIIANKKQLN